MLRFGRFEFRGGGVLGRRQPFFQERIPLVALRALPQQLRAPVAAPGADVRIQVEHRIARECHIAANERRLETERGKCLPHLLVDGEAVRVVRECIEQQL